MAIKKVSAKPVSGKSRKKTDPGASGVSLRARRITIFCVLLLLLLSAAAALIIGLLHVPEVLLTGNRRFELKHIRVISTGFWNGKNQEISERINVMPGQSVFSINVRKVRETINNIQSVDSCEVEVVLPDTLELRLTERVPRAMLYPQTNIVFDEYGNQFRRNESSAAARILPMIYNLRRNDAIVDQVKPALALIMTTLKDYPDISIRHIGLESSRYLKVFLVYRDQVRCNVLFPIREDYHLPLNTLQSAVLNSRGNVHNFDLRYDGQVVVR